MELLTKRHSSRLLLGGGWASQPAIRVEGFRLELVAELEVSRFGDGPVTRPHVNGVATGVPKGGGKVRNRAAVHVDCLLSCNHAAMLNAFSGKVQAHLASSPLKLFT